MHQVLLFPCEVCVPSDTFQVLFAPQAQRPQQGLTRLHWDFTSHTDQITLSLTNVEPGSLTIDDLKTSTEKDLIQSCWLYHDLTLCHVILHEDVDCKVLSVLTRFLRLQLLKSLGSVFILSTEEISKLTKDFLVCLDSSCSFDVTTLEYPELLDPIPDVPLPVPTQHAETLIRKLASKNKPGALRITLSEDGTQFDAEKLPRMTPAKLAEIMGGSRRPRFYLVRGTYACAFIGYLSRSTREEKPQLAILSHVKYISLCRAIRLIPSGGLRILRFVRYRHQIDVESLGEILEETNTEVGDKRRPVSLYSLKAPYNEDPLGDYDAEENFIVELVHRDFLPMAYPQLSQPVIEPS